MISIGFPSFLVFASTLSLSILATWLIRKIGLVWSVVAQPTDQRWHRQKTPILGGISIYFSFLAGYLLFVPREDEFLVLLLGASSMFLLGLIDDFWEIDPYLKLITQICAGAVLASFGVLLQVSDIEILNWLVSVVWLVGITNAFNLLDNMDGLCAGIALIAGFYRLILCSINGHESGVILSLVFLGAVAGFLLFNFNPASIFMGDAGSLFIGLLLAGMTISANHSQAKGIISVILFPSLLLMIPIFDTTLVSLTRGVAGRSVAQGGKDHVSHRLVYLGMSERKAVLLLYVVAAVFGALATLVYRREFPFAVVLAVLFLVVLALFGAYLSKANTTYDRTSRTPALSGRVFAWLIRSAYKKKVPIVLLDACLIVIAYCGAYWLRFDSVELTSSQLARLTESLPLLLVLSLFVFAAFGLYRQDWWHFGITDLIKTVKISFFAVVINLFVITFLYRFTGYSRSVFIIYWGAIIILLSASRLSFRILEYLFKSGDKSNGRALIYGAGNAGVLLVRELRKNNALGLAPVGFLDDNPDLLNRSIQGIPIWGSFEDLERLLGNHRLTHLIVSTGKIPADKLKRAQEICARFDLKVLRGSIRFDEIKVK